MSDVIEIEEEILSQLSNIQELLKSTMRSLYAFRDSQREWLLADLLNRPGPVWLVGINLSHTDLCQANLTDATLIKADLRGSNLESAILRRANLAGANLTKANLRFADLEGADLRDANVDGADFTGANLKDANLEDVDNLERATLTDLVNLNRSK